MRPPVQRAPLALFLLVATAAPYANAEEHSSRGNCSDAKCTATLVAVMVLVFLMLVLSS
jgi:hypothetical protein